MEMEYKPFNISVCDGIAFDYPITWKCAKVTSQSYIFLPKDQNDEMYDKCGLVVMRNNLKEELKSNVTHERFVKMITTILKDAKNVEHEDVVMGRDDVVGHWWKYDMEDEYNEEFAFVKDEVSYTIQLTTGDPKHREALGEMLLTVVDSFRLCENKGLKYAYFTPNNMLWECKRQQDGSKMETYIQSTAYLPSQKSQFWTRHVDLDGRRIISVSKTIDSLVLSYKLMRLPAHLNTADKYIEEMAIELEKESSAPIVRLPQSRVEKLTRDVGIGGDAELRVAGFSTQFTQAKVCESTMIMIIFEDTVYQFGISTLEGDMHIYRQFFDCIVGSFRLKEVSCHPSYRPEDPVFSLPTHYDLYANLMSGFRVLVPVHFQISEHSNHDSLIFVTKNDDRLTFMINHTPLEEATSLAQYTIDSTKWATSAKGAKLISQMPSRLDKYRAASMLVVAPSTHPNAKPSDIDQYLIKIAVVSQQHIGIRMMMRTLQSRFDNSYNSSLFMFDSFKLLD